MSNLTHYIHYDRKTGEIIGVSNFDDKSFEYSLNVSFDEARDFINGKLRFKDFLVGYKKDNSGKSQLSVIPAGDPGYSFKNNTFEWIKETSDEVECLVTWNGQGKRWEFQLDKRIKDYYNVAAAPKLVFFVTLEEDFDFLVRTIFINMHDLILSDLKYTVPFESNIESRIDKISISSKLLLKSYGLRIVNG